LNEKVERLNEIKKRIALCRACPLYKGRKNTVPGEGPADAPILLIGEAPGREEDETGRPFVGMAGRFLTDMLREAGVPRGSVFITSVIKCRPPGNRNPKAEEIKACRGFLLEQIEVIRPSVVVIMGNVALTSLRKVWNLPEGGVGEVRGRVYDVEDFHTIVTFHPAGVMRDRIKKRPLFVSDIKTAREIAVKERGRNWAVRRLGDF